MYVVVLACLLLGVQLVHSEKPVLQKVDCVPQTWGQTNEASKWDGRASNENVHKGDITPEDKQNHWKLADFVIQLDSKKAKDDAVVMCTAEIKGDEKFKGYWINRANDEANHIWVFEEGIDGQRITFGIKGSDCKESQIKVRVQLYGIEKGPSGARPPYDINVTCGLGNKGDKCKVGEEENEFQFLNRNQDDNA